MLRISGTKKTKKRKIIEFSKILEPPADHVQHDPGPNNENSTVNHFFETSVTPKS